MTVIKHEPPKEYDNETLKHIQSVLLDVLTDFVNICEENNIEYYCDGGTVLGAIRHQGFIPWDDDIDVQMFREEYEKFYEIMKEGNEKYDLLSYETEGFYRFSPKLNLKYTSTGETWDINANFTWGLGLDIAILDNVPTNKIRRFIFIKKALFIKRVNLLLFAMTNDIFFSKTTEKIGHFLKKVFKITRINQDFVKKIYSKLNSFPEGDEVGSLSCSGTFYPLPLKIFSPPLKVKFETIYVNVPNDYDTYLKILYGDYMRIPPKEEREIHGMTVDFGPY